MNDARKTKAQLIEELQALRAQVGGDPVGSRRLLAAERVRAEALAMRTSDDLHRVVAVLFHEMVAAGVESPCCSAQLYDFEEGVYDSFSAFVKPPRQDPSITSDALVDFDEEIGTTHISYSSAELQAISSAQFQDGVSRWRAGEPWSVPVTGSEPFSRIFHRLHSQLGFAGGFPGWEGDWVVTNVPFQYGSIAFRERQERPEHIDIARQLTQALAIGYRRFLDFQRLEEQNRRLEIEQILERVRGQALGMHRSDDLAAVAVTVFDELRALGVAIWRCGFFIFNDAHDPPEMEAWLTTAEGEPVRARWTYVLDAGAHPYMTGIYATWKRGEHRCNYLVGGDVVGLANHL
ncbi:MAG: hypothetical protein O2782_14885, partial [bacterium]|nr:hypothetical protein [bacterium]